MIFEILQWITIAGIGLIALLNTRTLGVIGSEKFLVKLVKRIRDLQVK